MQNNPYELIEKIDTRICELQRSHVSLQEQLKNTQHTIERNLDDAALRVIDILDMISMAKLNMDSDAQAPATAQLIIKKIEKRMIDLLKHWQVQEILFTDGRIETGKTRVLETRQVSAETPKGTIIEICRKGYQRGVKIIRPADVITAK